MAVLKNLLPLKKRQKKQGLLLPQSKSDVTNLDAEEKKKFVLNG